MNKCTKKVVINMDDVDEIYKSVGRGLSSLKNTSNITTSSCLESNVRDKSRISCLDFNGFDTHARHTVHSHSEQHQLPQQNPSGQVGNSADKLQSKPDQVWIRKLVFRSKLTMHTAFERSDNQTPAAVTALAISRDHRSVLVGDARGRVFVWSVPPDSARGGMTDQWVKDEGVTNCSSEACGVRFSLTERRHHCRNCGKVFCSRCSRFESEIYRLRLFKAVRVCQTCYNLLKVIQAPQIHDPNSTHTNPSSPVRLSEH